GGLKPSPSGDGFSTVAVGGEARRSCRITVDALLPARRAHGLRDPPAHRLDDKVPQTDAGGGGGTAGAGGDPAGGRGGGGADPEGARVEGSRAAVRGDPAAGDNQSAGAASEGSVVAHADDGVRAPEADVLGAAHLGTWVLLLQQRERDGRRDQDVH